MRPTISQLEGWNLDALQRAADAVRTNADSLYTSLHDCSRAVSTASKWVGQTKDAATAKVDQEVDHGHEVRNLLLRFADDATDAYQGFLHAKIYIGNKKSQAEAQGCTVADNGQVSHPDPEKAGDAGVYELDIMSGLDEIERIDGTFGAALRDIRTDLGAIRDGQPDVTTPDGRRQDPDAVVAALVGMTPDQRATFLASMSAEDRRQLVTAAPEKLGNMNGVPFEMRVAANELNIRNALFDEKRKPDGDAARIRQLEAMLAPIPNPETTDSRKDLPTMTGDTATPGNNLIDRKFVMFDPGGNGRMIEMIGDIKPGVHGLGVYVPGTSTNLNGSNTNHVAAWNLADRSKSPVFLYMEGDFPQSLANPADGAPNPRFAAEMAPRLVEFGREIDRAVASSAPGTPVTYVGHSYGGSIVGTAEQLGLRADRILHASSAGTGIYDTNWNNPNPNVQRYSMTAPGDLIGLVQSYPREGLNYPGGIALPGNPHAGNPLGGDPDEVPGVTRLDTGYYREDAQEAGHRQNEIIFGPDGHGNYWNDPTSDAFENIVNVVQGGTVTGYVERGVETPWVDVGLGDDGDGAKEAFDAAKAAAAGRALDVDPYVNPRVTDNPLPGRSIQVE